MPAKAGKAERGLRLRHGRAFISPEFGKKGVFGAKRRFSHSQRRAAGRPRSAMGLRKKLN